MSRPAARVLAALLATGLSACGQEEPRWIALAALPAGPAILMSPSEHAGGARLTRDQDGDWIEIELARADWRPMDRPGLWRAIPPLRPPGRGVASRAKLAAGMRTFVQQRSGAAAEPGSFAVVGDWIVLQLGAEELPPEHVTFTLHSARELCASGLARVNGRRFSGSGFSVWPGERRELALDLPPDSVLRVALCAEALQTSAQARAYRFRILLDGEALLDQTLAETHDGSLLRHALELPAAGRRGARLALEVSGPLGMTAFLEPVVAPRSAPAVSAPRRPDLVLFVADTFRADNLALYGGQPGLTPNLDALARVSLCYTSARSVATHTGPAHAALFSGQYPPRVSMDVFGNSLPEEVVTLAEELARAGYRTGAVTDSVIVSRSFGMSQGFDWFDELRVGMESTRARVRSFLEQDDGRPTFLFVHTYRVHGPYQSSPATRARLAPLLGPDQPEETDALLERLKSALRSAKLAGAELVNSETRALNARYEARYRAGVAEFDQEFGAFLGEPAVQALLDGGFLLFTSDHGEAFLEHGELHHSGRVYEEQVRVPLLLRGPGIEPGTRSEPVSLVDVTPTLADLAGLPPGAHWQGRSLRSAGAARPFLYAFECSDRRPSTLAVFAAERKLMGLFDAHTRQLLQPHAAFDLARDPRETSDLLRTSAGWPEELYRHLEHRRAELLEPHVEGARAEIDAEQRDELEELGYGGE